VPVRTMDSSGDAAQRIFTRSDRLKMKRIDAGAVTAKVVNDESARYWSDEGFVNCSMRSRLMTMSAIPATIDMTTPQPTHILVGKND